MKNNFKRFLSLLLAFVMVLGMMPAGLFAVEADAATVTVQAKTQNGTMVDLADCEYTYFVSGTTSTSDANNDARAFGRELDDGSYVYINLSGSATIPNKTTRQDTAIHVKNDGAVALQNGGTYLHFHSNESSPYWNRCSNYHVAQSNGHHDLYLLEKSEGATDSLVPGYTSVTAPSDGRQYLIAAQHGDGTWYLLYPTNSATKEDHAVELSVKNYTMEQYETVSFTVDGQQTAEVTSGSSVQVTTNAAKSGLAYSAGDAITDLSTIDGSQYVIKNVRGGTYVSTTANDGGLAMNSTIDEGKLWTITNVDGGITAVNNGAYLTIGSGSAGTSSEAVTLAIAAIENEPGEFSLGVGGQYLNDFGGGGTKAAGYGSIDAGSHWNICPVITTDVYTTTVTFYGAETGDTVVEIDGWTYNIHVNAHEHSYTVTEDNGVITATCSCGDEIKWGTIQLTGLTGEANSYDEVNAGEGDITKAFDGDANTHFATAPGGTIADCYIIANLDGTYNINKVVYTSRYIEDAVGNLKNITVWVSTDKEEWKQVAYTAEVSNPGSTTILLAEPVEAAYVKLTATESCHHNAPNTVLACAEFEVYKAICAEHTPAAAVEENRVEANCYKAGSYDSVVKCSVCSEEIRRESVTIPKREHDFANGATVSTFEGNCVDKSSVTKMCAYDDCNHTQLIEGEVNRDIHKTVVTLEAVAAGCESSGRTEGSQCTACNTVLVPQEMIQPTGHKPNEDDGDCTTAITCSVCGNETTAAQTEHAWEVVTYVEPTFSSNGFTIYRCDNSGCSESKTVYDDPETTKKMVASIGNTAYESLTEAIANAQDGNVILLQADTTENITLDKDVTVQLQQHTIHGQVVVKADAEIENGSIYAASGDAIIIGTKGSGNDTSVQFSGKNLNVTSMTDCAVLIYDGSASFDGGELKSNSANYAAIQGSGNDYGDLTLSGVTVTNSNEVAIYWPHVGTLSISGGSIEGTTGLYVKQGTVNLNVAKIVATGAKAAYTPNGNGCNSTGDAITVDTGATAPVVNLTGGNLSSAYSNLVGIYGGTVNVDRVAMNATRDAFRVEAGTLNLEAGSVTAGECAVYIRGGDVNVNGTMLKSTSTEYAAVQGNGNCGGNLTVVDGWINGVNEFGIYWPGSGNLTVNGGTVSGTTGIYAKQGNVTISDGIIAGNGAKADYVHNGNGGNATGDALVLESCDYGTLTASITGGTFESTNASAVAAYAQEGSTALAGFVSGGSFTSAVPESYCAEGYVCVEDGDKYVVTFGKQIAQNTTTGKKYTDLSLALNECASGETVVLLNDVDLTGVEWVPVGGYDASGAFTGTFDGQGYTIRNLTVTKTGAGSAKTRLALFSSINGATIKNLTVENAEIVAEGSDVRGAVLVMTANGNKSVIQNVTIKNSSVDVKSGSNGYAAGVVGWSTSIDMSDIHVDTLNLKVEATTEARAAAIADYINQADSGVSALNNFSIRNVTINAKAATTYVGGAMADINKGNQNTVGIGLTNGTVENLTITSTASSASNVGGLIGMSYKVDPQKVDNVTITGLDIVFTGASSKVGGVIGWDQSVSVNSTAKQGWYNDVHVSGTINENVTSGSGSEVGGFVGVSHQYPKIYTNCSADVDIVTGNRAGGFVGTPCPNGWNSQTDLYSNCTASGDVTAPVAGGFVGCAWLNNSSNTTLKLVNVTATGKVNGSVHAGGLIGYAAGTGGCSNIIIQDSVASETVVGPNAGNTAGVVGNSNMASGKYITLDNVTWFVEPPINPSNAPVKQSVAQVGETKYMTLAEAVAAAEAGDTVILLTDATGAGVVIDKSITIDLNGKTYTFNKGVGSTGTESNGFQILSGNSVTIKNGTLNIAANAADEFYTVIQNYADLTLTDVIVDATNADKWSETDGDSYAVSINSGNVVINGNTTIQANDEGDKAYAFDVCKYANYTAPVVTVAETVTINGKVDAAAKVGNVYYATFEAALAADGTVELLKPVTVTADTTYDLTGETIKSEGDAFVVTSGTLTLSGNGTVEAGTSGVGSWTAVWANGGHVVINGGTYSVGGDSNTTGTHQNDVIYTKNGGTVKIYGGTFLNDGTVWTLNENDANRGTITVYGGTFQAWNPADNVSEGEHTSFVAEGYCSAKNEENYYTVQKHEYEAVVTAPTCEDAGFTTYTCAFCGDSYIADEKEATGHSWGDPTYTNNGDGTHTASYVCANNAEHTKSDAPEAHDFTNGDCVCGAEAPVNYVAMIGENGYTTLADAVAEAQDGETIVLLAEVSVKNLTVDKKVTIDLNGNNLVMTPGWGEYAITVTGDLTIKGEGDVTVEPEMLVGMGIAVKEGAKLTIDGGNYTISGISGIIAGVEGEIVVNGGTFKGNSNTSLFNTGDNAKVTITGGEFNPVPIEERENDTRTIAISGGTYPNEIPAEWCAEGYVCVQQDENTWIVCEGQYVAQIGETMYTTLGAAVVAAQNGEIVILLEDIDLANEKLDVLDGSYDTYFKVEGKSITVDLNSKTISGAYTGTGMLVGVFSTENEGCLTLTGNGNVNVTATGKVYALLVNYEAGCSITIENGTYTLDKASDSLIYSDSSQAVTVNGGTFNLGNVGTGKNGSPWIFNVKGSNHGHIKVNGGTFNADVLHQHYIFEAQAPNTKALRANGDGTWTIVEAVAYTSEYQYDNYYAEIGYATIEEAVAAADADETVTLLTDITDSFELSKSIVLELNSKTYTGTITLTDAEAILTAAEGLNVVTNLDGYKVVYEDGAYKAVPVVYVAQIVGGEKYETLAEAIKAADKGDTITLLTDITENVTVDKSLTIDGDGKTYTGNIAVTGSTVDAVIKNVNFVGGTANYAVTTNSIKSITIENCTAKNYDYGFLYANKSTPTIVVKNVTVDNCNYGMHWVYGTNATLENVTMTNTAYGLYLQDYAAKTVTLKNCSISSIAVWVRGNEKVQTFLFEGANTVGVLDNREVAKYVLNEADATLTAPADNTVLSGVKGYDVIYEAGVYKLDKCVAYNDNTGKNYNDLSDALDEAVNGETVVLMQQTEEKLVLVPADVTFNLNGNVVKADNVLSFGAVIDTAETVGGIQISNDTTEAFTKLQPENGGYLPIYDTRDGMYKFFEYELENAGVKAENQNVKFGFQINFVNTDGYSVLANTEDSGVELSAMVTWTTMNVPVIEYHFDSADVKDYAAKKAENPEKNYVIYLSIGGLENLTTGNRIEAAPVLTTVTEVACRNEACVYTIE